MTPESLPSHQDPSTHLLTKQQACVWLAVSRATLDRLIHGRELDIVRVGTGRGSVRITERALIDYTRRRTTKGVANLPPREQGAR